MAVAEARRATLKRMEEEAESAEVPSCTHGSYTVHRINE